MDTTVCIVGAGISGLATAAFLAADADEGPPVDIRVLEADGRPGGVAWSERVDGRVIEQGPASWLSGEPALDRLFELTALQDQVLSASPSARTRWIWAGGARQPVPASPAALLGSRLLSVGGKLRLLAEPFVRRGDPTRDETVAEFFRRRLGQQVIGNLVAPMVAGIYGADPHRLSMTAAFPRLHAMEQEYGSLLMGAWKAPRSGPRPHLQGIRGGAGTLTRGLAELFADRIAYRQQVQAIEPLGDGWRVHTDQGSLSCQAVVLATPAYAQAAALRGVDAESAHALDEIHYAPIAVVTEAWAADAFPTPPEGFGVLVSSAGRREVPVLGTIFVSSTFPDHCPDGEILLRTMIGGTPDPGAVFLDEQEIARRAHDAHRRFLGDPTGQPRMTRVIRHARAIPQYRRGHLRRVAVARQVQAHHPGVFLAGNHFDGPGVRDCARTARLVARDVRAWLQE